MVKTVPVRRSRNTATKGLEQRDNIEKTPVNKLKRYNLQVPIELFKEVETLVDQQGTTVVELLKRFIKLGLLASRVQEKPGATLVIRDGEKERELLLI